MYAWYVGHMTPETYIYFSLSQLANTIMILMNFFNKNRWRWRGPHWDRWRWRWRRRRRRQQRQWHKPIDRRPPQQHQKCMELQRYTYLHTHYPIQCSTHIIYLPYSCAKIEYMLHRVIFKQTQSLFLFFFFNF